MKARASLKGFSLVELIVVIAIVALLAVVAVPFYRDFSNKNKLKGVDSVVREQLDVWVEQNALGTTPDNMTGDNTGNEYISSIVFTRDGSGGGTVVVVLDGSKLPFTGGENITETWTATTDNNVTTWTCTYRSSTDYSNFITNCDLEDQGDDVSAADPQATEVTASAEAPAEATPEVSAAAESQEKSTS